MYVCMDAGALGLIIYTTNVHTYIHTYIHMYRYKYEDLAGEMLPGLNHNDEH